MNLPKGIASGITQQFECTLVQLLKNTNPEIQFITIFVLCCYYFTEVGAGRRAVHVYPQLERLESNFFVVIIPIKCDYKKP